MSWTASANALIANMNKPDYRRIAVLEVEVWGEVYTKEAKEFQPAPLRRGPHLRQSDEATQRNVDEMNALLTELGME